jgi:hypothetical protein
MTDYIPKSELKDGAYYEGSCRNASIARWNATKSIFLYNRRKFNDVFVEDINHPEDDNGFDLFYPEKEIPYTTEIHIPTYTYMEGQS